jgi:hypothetical protein
MQFLKEIEAHLENFESTAKEEIQKFIAHLYTKYQPVTDAVVPPSAPLTVTTPVPAPVTLVPVCAPAADATPEPTPEITVSLPEDNTSEVTITPAPTTCAPTAE